jgi:hypothetical protein
VSDDNDIDELEGEVCDYNCSGLTRGHDWHRRVPLLRCVLVADVVPCLNPFGDAHVNAAELGGSNVSLLRALFPPGRQRAVSELLDAALDRLCEVERLSVIRHTARHQLHSLPTCTQLRVHFARCWHRAVGRCASRVHVESLPYNSMYNLWTACDAVRIGFQCLRRSRFFADIESQCTWRAFSA